MQDPADPSDTPLVLDADQGFCCHFIASQDAVRIVLRDLRAWLETAQPCPDTQATVELVLAEALNNIVEHAYADHKPGPVHVEVWRHHHELSFVLSDCGSPMPSAQLPAGQLPELSCATADLPEGGFGWFLIRRLTTALRYEHNQHQNRLCFSISCNSDC